MSRMGEVVELYRLETTHKGLPYVEVITMHYTAIGAYITQDISIGEGSEHKAHGVVNLTDDVIKRLIASYRKKSSKPPVGRPNPVRKS